MKAVPFTPVRVVIIANPRSGRGRAARVALAARDWLESRAGGGHEVILVTGGPESDPADIDAAIRGAGVLVVAGGDGSVHHAAPVAMRADVPLYHLPCGNENLIAREFGMTRRPEDLSRAIETARVATVDVGSIEITGATRHFLIMVSFGPDASIVHRLTASRTRASGHLAYTRPLIAEFLRPHLPRLSVRVDGKPVVDQRRGVLVIANCRQYAFRIDPCYAACMDDGKLDLLFMPSESSWSVARWGWRCWRHKAVDRGAVTASGKEIEIEGDALWQVDGEHGGRAGCRTQLLVKGSVRLLRGV